MSEKYLRNMKKFPKYMCKTSKECLKIADIYLVMQVRVLTEAPLPQLREQTDQPLHAAHSFRKCSCRRARAGRPDAASPEGCHAETHD